MNYLPFLPIERKREMQYAWQRTFSAGAFLRPFYRICFVFAPKSLSLLFRENSNQRCFRFRGKDFSCHRKHAVSDARVAKHYHSRTNASSTSKAS